MMSEDEVKALKTHLKVIQTKIPKEYETREVVITLGMYLRLLSGAQISVTNEILETIDKDTEEKSKHQIVEEFEKLKGA